MNKTSNNQTDQNISLIANLTWKELETIYYLSVPSLKDYAGNVSDLFNNKEKKSKVALGSKNKTASKQEKRITEPDEEKQHIDDSSGEQILLATPPALPTENQIPKTAVASTNQIALDQPKKDTVEPHSKPELAPTKKPFTANDTFNNIIAQPNKTQRENYISNSPFAKLKSNVPGIVQSSLSQPIPAKPIQALIEKLSSPSQPIIEDAWFIEPAQNAKTELPLKAPDVPGKVTIDPMIVTPKSAPNIEVDKPPVVTEIAKTTIDPIIAAPTSAPSEQVDKSAAIIEVAKTIVDPIMAPPPAKENKPSIAENSVKEIVTNLQPAPSEPAPNPMLSLDLAIENAFGRMLGPSKNKLAQLNNLTKPVAPLPEPVIPTPPARPDTPAAGETSDSVIAPEPKLLPFSAESTKSQSTASENSTEQIDWKPVFDTKSPVDINTASANDTSYSALFDKSTLPQTQSSAPAFDFSAAETSAKNQSPEIAAIDKSVETGDTEPVKALDIKTPNTTEVQDDLIVSSDALRDLIHNHIKHAAGQGADASGQSIGNGKEFEVWLNNPSRSKFVGASKTGELPNTPKNSGNFKPRVVPPDIRKSCLILGIRPENITYESVQESWKKAIALPGVHPDQGGDTEMAVYLNTAKDVLVRWLDAQAPKLGKKFGPSKKD